MHALLHPLLETVSRLDAQDNVPGLLAFLKQGEHNPQEMLFAVSQLLYGERTRAAFILAAHLANRGYRNGTTFMALCIGGLLHGDMTAAAYGLSGLRAQADATPVAEHAAIYDQNIGLITYLLRRPGIKGEKGRVQQVIDILRESVPRCRTLFDRTMAAPTLPQQGVPHRKKGEAKPLAAPLPRPDWPRQRRRVVISQRLHLFLHQTTWPRPLDLERRLATAMGAYGWEVELCPIQCFDLHDDYQAIMTACQRQQAELLILDEDLVLSRKSELETRLSRPFLHDSARSEETDRLRKKLPGLKIAAILCDTQLLDTSVLSKLSAQLDLILDMGALFPTALKRVSDNIIHMPVPHAAELGDMKRPLTPYMLFAGEQTPYSQLWLAATDALGLPVRHKLADSFAAQQSTRDRYTLYRQGLAKESCYLQFASHPCHAGPVTTLCFETILNGALLIQESSPNMHHYFVPGEHYLEFASLAELAAIARFISEKPQEADAIRRCGTRFARTHYQDEQWIGAIDKHLYSPERSTGTTQGKEAQPTPEVVTYEYFSVHKWCRPVPPSELLTASGPAISYYDGFHAPDPPLDLLGLHALQEGFAEVFPWHEAAMIYPYLDFKTHRMTPPAPQFVARLDNVLVEHPLQGVFLDRHLLMEESHYDKRLTITSRKPWNMLNPWCTTQFEIHPPDKGPDATLTVDVKYRLDTGVDHYDEEPTLMIGGRGASNYHHWLMEYLPRLWCLDFVPELRGMPIFMHTPLTSFQVQTLGALGITPDKVKPYRGNIHMKTLIFPSFMSPPYIYSMHCFAWLRDKLTTGLGAQVTSTPHELIYISRNRATRRILLNEPQVMAEMEKRHFKILYMEDLTVKEQIEQFSRAKVVVMPHGAGSTNMLFANPGSVLIALLPKRDIHGMCVLYTSFNQSHYGAMICDDSGSPLFKNMTVDLPALLKIVDKVLAGLS
ncbi:MAG: glycosyltransferase 61 family protein [Magnetococcus sp. YQC-3]